MGIIKKVIVVAGVLALALWLGLPRLTSALGLHPECEPAGLNLSGRRALVVATSRAELGSTGKATGVAFSELTAPYYEFLDAGIEVDIASIEGGKVPVDPQTLLWFIRSHYDRRFLDDAAARAGLERSLGVAEVDFGAYDIVYLAGGWGAAWDLGTSEVLGDGVTEAYTGGAVVGGVCHGPLGLLKARDEEGWPLVAGRRLTAVTNKQVHELGIAELTPQHPERELRRAGAMFESRTAFRDLFATHVVRDGRVVTGQNQNSGCATAQEMMRLVLNDP